MNILLIFVVILLFVLVAFALKTITGGGNFSKFDLVRVVTPDNMGLKLGLSKGRINEYGTGIKPLGERDIISNNSIGVVMSDVSKDIQPNDDVIVHIIEFVKGYDMSDDRSQTDLSNIIYYDVAIRAKYLEYIYNTKWNKLREEIKYELDRYKNLLTALEIRDRNFWTDKPDDLVKRYGIIVEESQKSKPDINVNVVMKNSKPVVGHQNTGTKIINYNTNVKGVITYYKDDEYARKNEHPFGIYSYGVKYDNGTSTHELGMDLQLI